MKENWRGKCHTEVVNACCSIGWIFCQLKVEHIFEVFVFHRPAVQQKMSEENGARMRAESRVVEVEKQCSMLEFDLKQSVQKMEQLMKQKERLEDEASNPYFNI